MTHPTWTAPEGTRDFGRRNTRRRIGSQREQSARADAPGIRPTARQTGNVILTGAVRGFFFYRGVDASRFSEPVVDSVVHGRLDGRSGKKFKPLGYAKPWELSESLPDRPAGSNYP